MKQTTLQSSQTALCAQESTFCSE